MKKQRMLLFVFGIVLVILASVIVVLLNQGQETKDLLPYLIEGDKIDYFELVGTENRSVNAEELADHPLSLIFLFKEPCSICNGNIRYWNRIAKILNKDGIKIYGVVFGGLENLKKFEKEAALNFDVYTPKNRQKFRAFFRLKHNMPQSLLCRNNTVFMNLFGKLDGELYRECLQTAKLLLKNTDNS